MITKNESSHRPAGPSKMGSDDNYNQKKGGSK